jgi:hypothetical protein
MLDVKNSVRCPSSTHAAVMQEKALPGRAILSHLAASRIPPAARLADILRSFL